MKDFALALGLVIVAAAVGGCVWLWSRGAPTQPSDYAAWAQAITAAAAIVVTFVIVLWQHHIQLDRDARAALQLKADRAETAYQLAAYLEVVCKKVIAHTAAMNADRVYLTGTAGELDAIGSALTKFEASDFPSYDELKPLMAITAARSALAEALAYTLPKVDQHSMAAHLNGAFSAAIDSITKEVGALKLIAGGKKQAASG